MQKVRSFERFIHMLTCLLLSRTMYHMALLDFRELIDIIIVVASFFVLTRRKMVMAVEFFSSLFLGSP